jgi:hypothetical protein
VRGDGVLARRAVRDPQRIAWDLAGPPPRRRSSRIAIAIATAGAVVLLVNQVLVLRGESAPDIAATVDAVVPAGGCTLSDAPSKLVTTDRFVARAPGCTDMTDPQGATLSSGYASIESA